MAFLITLLYSFPIPEKFSAAMQPGTLLNLLEVEGQKIEEESEVSLRFKLRRKQDSCLILFVNTGDLF